jgi:hypothetical protein
MTAYESEKRMAIKNIYDRYTSPRRRRKEIGRWLREHPAPADDPRPDPDVGQPNRGRSIIP